jgi:hypothetical protein
MASILLTNRLSHMMGWLRITRAGEFLDSSIRWTKCRLARMQRYFETSDLEAQFPSLADFKNFLKETSPVSLVYVIAAILVSALLVYTCLFRRRRSSSQPSGDLRICAPLNAVLTFLTPTSSVWPTSYLPNARHSILDGRATFSLPLHTLFDDVISGAIELRNPAVDLPAFILRVHRPRGWAVMPYIKPSWHIHAVMRTVCLQLASFAPLVGAKPFNSSSEFTICASWLHILTKYMTAYPLSRTSFSIASLSKSQNKVTSSQELTMFVLDAVPYPCLTPHVRTLQTSLLPGASAILGFSTIGSLVSVWSAAYIQASIPFFGRRHITRASRKIIDLNRGSNIAHCPSLDMTPTPLLTTLAHILKLLASGPVPSAVESVQDVSDQYASYLERYVQELTNIPKVRDRFISQWGVIGWREERLLVSWEAALFRARLMSRWVVFVTRRGYAG